MTSQISNRGSGRFDFRLEGDSFLGSLTLMTVAAQKQIVEKALSLPKGLRRRLAHQLLDSLEQPEEKISSREWTRLWKAELEKRSEEMESGKVKGIPASKVMAELRAKYG